MTRKDKDKESDIPAGYTAEQWAAYQADPVAVCVTELASKDRNVRFNAVDILRGCAGDAKKAIPALCELLGTENVATIRAQCAWALQDICERVDAPSAQQAVAPLAKALLDNDAEVRTLAANALGAIGGAAKDALPELKKALTDRDGEVRQAAAKALERIGQ